MKFGSQGWIVEIREYAERVLFGTQLEEKLTPFTELTDEHPGKPIEAPLVPVRPKDLSIQGCAESAPFPKLRELEKETARGRLLHFFANHELLATEIMALVLLRFPDAPPAFRRGVAKTLREEQEHTQLYLDRMRAFGCEFGQFPVTGFFWQCLRDMASPLDYVSGLPLTFEQANLDFSQHFASVFRQLGDGASEQLMERIYRDEIRHVAYGLKWFREWKAPDLSDWEAYERQLRPPLSPRRAKASPFNETGRVRCGLSADFIGSLSIFAKSRGRRPDIYLWNPLAEFELARGPAFTPNKQQLALVRDLETLPQFLAKEDDAVAVSELPQKAFLLTQREAGLPVPEFIAMRDGGLDLGGDEARLLGRFRPWAAVPSAWEAISAQRNLFQNSEMSAVPAALFGKELGAELLQAVLASESDVEWLCPVQDVGRVVDSLAAALEAIAEFRSDGFRKLVVKANLGAAGNRQLRLWEPDVTEAQQRWMEKLFRFGERVVVEPWHERVFDFSVHYEVEPKEVRLVGFVRLHNDARGQFLASEVAPRLTHGLEIDCVRFLHGPESDRYRHLFERVGAHVGTILGEEGYRGPVGVDAYVARDASGRLFLKPVVEVNPRYTMGRLALAFSRLVHPGRVIGFALVSQVSCPRFGVSELGELPGWLREHFPLEWAKGPSRRLRDGALCVTDAARAREVVGVLAVGSAVGELLAGLKKDV